LLHRTERSAETGRRIIENNLEMNGHFMQFQCCLRNNKIRTKLLRIFTTWRWLSLPLMAFVALLLATTVACAQQQLVRVTGVDDKSVGLIDISADLQALPGSDHQHSIETGDTKSALGRLPERGDILLFSTMAGGQFKSVSAYVVRPGTLRQILALIGAAGVLIGLAAIVTKWRPQKFLIGIDNRYSNSQCQLALWFGTAMTAYLAMVFLRLYAGGADFLGGVTITENVFALSGLSALTFGGAKMVTAQKTGGTLPVPETPAASERTGPVGAGATGPIAAQPPQPLRKNMADNPNLLTDLVQNDEGAPDLGDFQMIAITLTAVVIYLTSTFNALASIPLQAHVSLPDVDTSLLAGFGIGQGAYLVKKAALPLGRG